MCVASKPVLSVANVFFFQIVEEEVAVGWRTVQKARVSVAAKWKVRPIKLEAVRAHHNFRPSSGRYFLCWLFPVFL
jgi:hypothetical protein